MGSGSKYMIDKRPLDQWGNPIGKGYDEKRWEELSPEEMMADFDWKTDILRAYGEEVSESTFYQDYLFYELYNGEIEGDYKVLLTEYDAQDKNKVHKIDVDEISDYLNLNDVAISPCLFYSNWRKKKLLNYVSAFVLDIDKLRPENLQRFLRLFDEGRLLKPTFIVNSGSGVHFYYVLDEMLRCDAKYREANKLIAEEVYKSLYDDVIKKEKWPDAQRHWVGQDYRVVNSKTKLYQVSNAFKVGDTYTIDELREHYQIEIDPKKKYATKSMIKYATNIAKDLDLELPNFENSKETYDFIKRNKDAAYLVREQRRQERQAKKKGKKSRKATTWYKNTLFYMRDHTNPGHRFSSMKALAIIAFKEKVSREVFISDIEELAEYWSNYDWQGDNFNAKNVEAIVRLFDGAVRYSNTSAETLEEWLGYEFKRIGNKRNGRSQEEHLGRARAVQNFDDPEGNWRNKDGRPKVGQIVLEYRQNNPEARKADCIRDTGLSKPTVYKWWDGEPKAKSKKKDKDFTPGNPSADAENMNVKKEILDMLLNMSEEEVQEFWKMYEEKKAD